MVGTIQGCCALLAGVMLSVASVKPPQKNIRWHFRLITGFVGVVLLYVSMNVLFSY